MELNTSDLQEIDLSLIF